MSGAFEKNLSLLSRRDPALAEKIRAIRPPESSASEEPGPVRPGNPDAVVVVGIGRGAAAREVCGKVPASCWVVVVEPREDRFRAALEFADCSELLGRARTVILVGDSFRGPFREWLVASQALDFYLLATNPGTCEPVLRTIADELNRRRTEVATLVDRSERMVRNRFANLPWTVRSAAWRSFEGRLAGVPAVVVAAGPSLDAHEDDLRRARGRAVIVSVGKSLRWLIRRGIAPEFVCHLDVAEESDAVFVGFEVPGETTLVWDPESSPGAVARFPGDRATYEGGAEWGRPFWGEKGAGGRGMTVAHTAFLFARALGADPITLVGVDLALPGERTHAEGVTMTWGGDVAPLAGGFVDVPAAGGGTVRSLPAFRAMVTLFEEEIARTKARVVNASAVGARIAGAEAGAVELGGPVDVRGRIAGALAEPRPFDREAFREAAGRWAAAADRITAAADAGEAALERRSVAEVNARRSEILAETDLEPLIRRLLAPEAVRIQQITRRMEGVDASVRARLDVERTLEFFRGYRRAARVFREAFAPARDELLR